MKTLIYFFVMMFSVQISHGQSNILVDANADDIVEEIAKYQGEKPVLVNFWATWCAPCIEEFPHLMKLKEKYDEEFKLILVSADFDEARTKAEDFLKKHGVNFKIYFKKGKDDEFISTISEEWSGALPYTIVYNKEGSVSASWEGKADLERFESTLQRVISEE